MAECLHAFRAGVRAEGMKLGLLHGQCLFLHAPQ
jgi:hypothetical protein